MQEEVRAGQLADATVSMRPLTLTDEQLAALAALPNVAAVEPRSIRVDTRVLVGERRAPARVIGVRDFARQGVDVVRVESGRLPGPGEVLADVQDANVGVYDGRAGDTLSVVGTSRGRADSAVSGRGRSLPGRRAGPGRGRDRPLRASGHGRGAERRARVRRARAVRLRDPSPAAAARRSTAVRRYLADGARASPASADLPEVRAPGDWPGKAETEKFAQLLSVITVLALLSALVLISNTMTTLVAEQTGEIGIMRAIGARRRQVALVYLRTALLLGALGALAGIALGIALSNLLADYFGSHVLGDRRRLRRRRDGGAASASRSGCLGRRSPRCPRSAAASASTSARRSSRPAPRSASEDAADRLLRRARFLPRTMQIGLRSVGRRKRRSLATALIVALAVAQPARVPRPRRGGDREPRARRGATTSRTCRSRRAGERSSTSARSA